MDTAQISHIINDTMMGSYHLDTIGSTLSDSITQGVTSGGLYSGPWTIPPMTTNQITHLGPVWTDTGTSTVVKPNGRLELNGNNADIVVNGESMIKTLSDIQERLNILRPNQELEDEWDQLRELGEQYRELESQLIEKSKMWATLKK